MLDWMKAIATMLIALLVTTLVVVGAGYGLSLIVPLSSFQATVILQGIVIAAIAVFGLYGVNEKLNKFLLISTEWDESEVVEAMNAARERERVKNRDREAERRAERAVLNALCDCGSKRKFKYCCMKKKASVDAEEVIHF